MFRRKQGDYAAHTGELQEQDITYRPLVWSAWGRAHPETSAMLAAVAVQAARRRGLRDHRLLLRRSRGNVGVLLMRRAARMLHACVPRRLEDEEEALDGGGGVPDEGGPRHEPRAVRFSAGEAEAV